MCLVEVVCVVFWCGMVVFWCVEVAWVMLCVCVSVGEVVWCVSWRCRAPKHRARETEGMCKGR